MSVVANKLVGVFSLSRPKGRLFYWTEELLNESMLGCLIIILGLVLILIGTKGIVIGPVNRKIKVWNAALYKWLYFISGTLVIVTGILILLDIIPTSDWFIFKDSFYQVLFIVLFPATNELIV